MDEAHGMSGADGGVAQCLGQEALPDASGSHQQHVFVPVQKLQGENGVQQTAVQADRRRPVEVLQAAGLLETGALQTQFAASDSALDCNPALIMPATLRDSIPSVWYLLTRFLLTWCWVLLRSPVIRQCSFTWSGLLLPGQVIQTRRRPQPAGRPDARTLPRRRDHHRRRWRAQLATQRTALHTGTTASRGQARGCGYPPGPAGPVRLIQECPHALAMHTVWCMTQRGILRGSLQNAARLFSGPRDRHRPNTDRSANDSSV